jgi:hypothetical protein
MQKISQLMLTVGLALVRNFVDRVEHGGVMFAAELPPDFRERGRGELFHKEHGDLARECNHSRIAAHL